MGGSELLRTEKKYVKSKNYESYIDLSNHYPGYGHGKGGGRSRHRGVYLGACGNQRRLRHGLFTNRQRRANS